MKKLAVIWDRDGTLASIHNEPEWKSLPAGKQRYMREVEFWKDFNNSIRFDAPVPSVVALLRAVRPGITNIMLTARADGDYHGCRRNRLAVVDWIEKYNLPIDLLLMREAKDLRPSAEVKETFLNEVILPKFEVIMAIDDSDDVIEMWEKNGIFAIKVTDPKILPPIACQSL